MKLRPYQRDALAAIHESFRDHGASLLVFPTGTGKTVAFGRLIADRMKYGRVLVLTHTRELVMQTASRLTELTGERPDIEMGGFHADHTSRFWRSRIVVATVQTLNSIRGDARRVERFDPQQFATLVIDEAHHVPASTWRRVVKHFRRNPNLRVLGVTATPNRTDEKALGTVFDHCAYRMDIRDAIRNGWLVPIEQRMVYVDSLDFSGIRSTAGDLNGAELAALMEQERNLHEVVSATRQVAKEKRTLLFAASVAQAERMAEIFNRHDHASAACIHGGTERQTRKEILLDFKRGRFQWLVNVGVLLEGFDDPGIECVSVARPTKSQPLYTQMIGRGTRPLPGVVDGPPTAEDRKRAIAASRKPSLLVLDFAGNAGTHKLISALDALAGDTRLDAIERAKEIAPKKDVPEDVLEAIEEARLLVEREKRVELTRRKELKARAKVRTKTVDPFALFDLPTARHRPSASVEPPKLSEKQVEVLEGEGLIHLANDPRTAKIAIEEVFRRRREGLCTTKQAGLLAKYRFPVRDMTKDQASAIIATLAKSKWRLPNRIIPAVPETWPRPRPKPKRKPDDAALFQGAGR